MADDRTDLSTGTPLWVKVQGILVLFLIVAVAAMSAGALGDHSQDQGEPSGSQQHMGGH